MDKDMKTYIGTFIFAIIIMVMIGKVAILPQLEKGLCKVCDEQNYTGEYKAIDMIFNCNFTETKINECKDILGYTTH